MRSSLWANITCQLREKKVQEDAGSSAKLPFMAAASLRIQEEFAEFLNPALVFFFLNLVYTVVQESTLPFICSFTEH